jgi:HlyD family secretion protein
VLARLEPSLFQAAIEQARASLVRAEADADRLRVAAGDAAVKLARAQELSARQLIPATELDAARVTLQSARAQVRSAEAQVTQAQAALRQAEVNLAKTVIASPIDGIVIARNVDVGQTVAASLQAPTLFEIAADLARMQLKASIDEADLGRIQPGQPVQFTVDAYPDEIFTGRVEQVRLSPVVSQNVVTYSTIISAPNPALKLKPGMTASVTIETARRDGVLRVPNAAVRFRPAADVLKVFETSAPSAVLAPGTARVWRYADGRLRPVAVTIGAADERFTEVTGDGIAEGEQVVTRITLAAPASSQGAPATSPLIPSGPPRR